MIEYQDFSLKIEPKRGESYPVIVLRSPAGEGRSSFKQPFDPENVGDILFDLGQKVKRSGQSPLRDASPGATRTGPQQIGDQLFNALFSGPVRSLLDRSLGMIHGRQQGLRIKLHIDPEDPSLAQLASLPWEFLYRKETRDFLNLSRFTPILRYLDVQRPYTPLPLEPPLRILVVISDPLDYARLDLVRERDKIEASWARHEGVQVEFMEQATTLALQDRLTDQPYHALHYMGHGDFDESTGRGVLVMEDEGGKGSMVDGSTLGVLLRDLPTMRLVFLNACETARVTKDKGLDPFAGVAAAMVMAGIPAVVAMQFPISDDAAITFSQKFYPLLARGDPVDTAMAEGRRAIRLAEARTMEWGTPVLFMRAPQGKVFQVSESQRVRVSPGQLPELPEEMDEELEQRLAELYTRGLSAFWLEEWEKAARCFQAIVGAQPNYEDAVDKLAEANRQARLHALYTQAQAAQEAEDWPVALAALEELATEAADYKDCAVMLQAVKSQKQLAGLYAEAQRLFQAGQWQAVVNVFGQIDAIEPQYPDPDGLLPVAEQEIAEQKRQAELTALYSLAVREMDAGRWLKAHQLLAQVQEKEPDYEQAERLLARVEAEIAQEEAERQRQEQIATLHEQALGLAAAEKWQQVLEKMDRIWALDAQFADPEGIAAKSQAEAERQQRLDTLYAQAQAARQAKDWPVAITALKELLAEAPDYRDAGVQLQAAEKQARLAELYAEAGLHHQAKEWQAVLDTFAQIQAIEPDYPDPEDLLPTAEREAAALKRQAELSDLYGRAVEETDAGHWREARRLLVQVQEMEPGYQEAEGLLTRVTAEIEREEAERHRQEQITTLYEQAQGLARARQWQQVLATMEEIRRLEPHFSDPEGLAARAQEELAREEQEARRQAELAALYAEAVRLLRAGQYQEALQKWEEVQAQDSRYRDRKRVQATAKRKLAALGRQRLPGWVWVLGAAVLILAVVAVLLATDVIPWPTRQAAAPQSTPVPAQLPSVEAAPYPAATEAATGLSGQQYYSQGVDALEQGLYVKAISEFDRALALDWESEDLYYQRARACYQWAWDGGDCSYEQAIEDATKAIELDPNDAEYWILRGMCYYAQEDYQAAMADQNQAIEVDPRHPSAYVERAQIHSQLGALDLSIADWTKALELAPEIAVFWFERGKTYYQQRDAATALPDLDEAIKLDPQVGSYWLYRGMCHYALGDNQAALSDQNQAIELEPEGLDAYVERAQIRRSTGKLSLAIADWTKAIELAPENSLYRFERAVTYLETGNGDAALVDFDAAIRLNPEDPAPYAERAGFYHGSGAYDLSIADWTKAIEIDPNYSFYAGRAWAHYDNSDLDLAFSDITMASQLNPFNADYWHTRGRWYYEQGNYEAALDDLNKAIGRDPRPWGYLDESLAYSDRAATFAQLGQVAEARADYEKFLELTEGDTRYGDQRMEAEAWLQENPE